MEATSSAAVTGATLPALCSGWAAAVGARAGTALVGGAPVLQDVMLSGLNPPGSPLSATQCLLLQCSVTSKIFWLTLVQLFSLFRLALSFSCAQS